jgi:Fe-S oxidoreductase
MAETAEKLMEIVGAAGELPDPGSAARRHGAHRALQWKAILDFYTCTECGRCSDNCPAHRTGKILSPKHLTLDLRNHLYGREREFIEREGGPKGSNGVDGHARGTGTLTRTVTIEGHQTMGATTPTPDHDHDHEWARGP